MWEFDHWFFESKFPLFSSSLILSFITYSTHSPSLYISLLFLIPNTMERLNMEGLIIEEDEIGIEISPNE